MDQEDFTYLVYVNDAGPFHFREVTPKDFYLAQVLRQQERGFTPLLLKLLVNDEILDQVRLKQFTAAIDWAVENIVDRNVLTVENWLETAYHLCKQRWDSSIEWLETQPMSKVMLMVDIVRKHGEEQEAAAKKAARKKK